jgi:putative ABC transport system substrate-binding protein
LIAALANRHHVPAIFGAPSAPASGGLIAYGPNPEGVWQALAEYIDRILRGTPLRDLPVQAPTSYSLIVNLRTARALDLTIPLPILAAADEMIE